MNEVFISAASVVQEGDLANARLGSRFGRLDLQSRLALLAVETLGVNFDAFPRDRIAICLAAPSGSLSTDVEYWQGREAAGGPSPTLFAYTLPSAAIGEIAIRNRLTGPNLCFVGDDRVALREAAELILAGEAESCVCVSCNVITAAAATLLSQPSLTSTCALFLRRGSGPPGLGEFDRDMQSLCALFSARNCAD